MAVAAAGVHFFRGAPLEKAWRAKCCADAKTSITTPRRGAIVKVRSLASSSSTSTVEQTAYEKGQGEARWAGDDPLARFVTGLVSIEPLYRAITFVAQKVMIRTAEKSGVPWQKMVKEIKESDVYAEKDLVENINVSYPDYYIKAFHSYRKGNLSWEAAFDAEPATKVVMKRAFKHIASPQLAEETFRFRWLKELEAHHTKFSNGLQAGAILDIGCSIGISSRYLRNHFPVAQVTGLDLSPYYLAVARHIQNKEATESSSTKRNIEYVHANGEETGLPSESFDIISCAFLCHELPQSAAKNILREARRLVKPGGTIALIDISPEAKAIQELAPALFVMMKATEPWLDEYFTLDLKGELERNGFTNITSSLTSPRHATITATAT
ncbi:unnamed protein product [Calypogeia fissa]